MCSTTVAGMAESLKKIEVESNVIKEAFRACSHSSMILSDRQLWTKWHRKSPRQYLDISWEILYTFTAMMVLRLLSHRWDVKRTFSRCNHRVSGSFAGRSAHKPLGRVAFTCLVVTWRAIYKVVLDVTGEVYTTTATLKVCNCWFHF
jgi:hypothetical protein